MLDSDDIIATESQCQLDYIAADVRMLKSLPRFDQSLVAPAATIVVGSPRLRQTTYIAG